MQPVPWRARTLALSLWILFSVLFMFVCQRLVPRGGHNAVAALLALAGIYGGMIVFVISAVRLALHGISWLRAGRPRSPFRG
jgi:hypothetical protein